MPRPHPSCAAEYHRRIVELVRSGRAVGIVLLALTAAFLGCADPSAPAKSAIAERIELALEDLAGDEEDLALNAAGRLFLEALGARMGMKGPVRVHIEPGSRDLRLPAGEGASSDLTVEHPEFLKAIPTLVHAMRIHPNAGVRGNAAAAIGEISHANARVLDALLAALTDGAGAAPAAIAALARLGPRERSVMPHLVKLVGEGAWPVRVRAAITLRWMAGDEGEGEIAALLKAIGGEAPETEIGAMAAALGPSERESDRFQDFTRALQARGARLGQR